MSKKPIFEKIAKHYVDKRRSAFDIDTIINKITIYSNNVNKTRLSVQLLAITTLHYYVITHKEVNDGLGITSTTGLTSSPAVTVRPRDASCMSVVSFNSAVFHYYYFGFRFTTAYN